MSVTTRRRSAKLLSAPVFARVFPGDRWIWITAAATAAVLLVVLLAALLQPREEFTGSNSVGVRNGIVHLGGGAELCARRQYVPAGTGTVRFAGDRLDEGLHSVRAVVRLQDGTRLVGATPWRQRFIDIAVPGLTRATSRAQIATVCVQPLGGGLGVWGQTLKQSNELSLTLGKERLDHRMAIWYRPSGDAKTSILASAGDILERASLFRPRFVGPWTYVLILAVLFPALGYAAVRLVATAGGRRSRVLIAAVGALTFLHAASWAFVTPAFQTPDEGEHYAYVQYFAETGKAVDPVAGDRPTWSSEQGITLENTRYSSVIERDEVNFPWDSRSERMWRARIAEHPPRDNGGGFHPATSSHSPAYYAALAPAYLVTKKTSTFSKLTAMRLTSAVMAAITAALAVLTALELLPRRRQLAVVAGLLVGFLPMFGFMGGGVNNDNAVNLVAAALIFLVIRALRRGLTVPIGLGIGFALAAAPIMKATAYALYPPAFFAIAVLAWRHRRRADLPALLAIAASFFAVYFGWAAIAETFNRTSSTMPGGVAPTQSLGARHNIPGFLSWFWQVLVPFKFSFMADFTIVKWPFFEIYVKRGFAGFGWYALYFKEWVYVAILAVGGVVAGLGTWGLLRGRQLMRGRWAELAFLLLVPVAVVTAIEAAYFTIDGLPKDGVAEQGRYGFTALTAVAALAAAACAAGGRRHAARIGVVLVTAMLVLAYAGQWLTLSSFYL